MPPVVYHHCLHTCLFNHLTTESQTYPLRSTTARTILMLAAGPTSLSPWYRTAGGRMRVCGGSDLPAVSRNGSPSYDLILLAHRLFDDESVLQWLIEEFEQRSHKFKSSLY